MHQNIQITPVAAKKFPTFSELGHSPSSDPSIVEMDTPNFLSNIVRLQTLLIVVKKMLLEKFLGKLTKI